MTEKKAAKLLEATTNKICQEELSDSHAQISIMDLGKLAAVTKSVLAAPLDPLDGRTAEDLARISARDWIMLNRKN